MKNNHSIKNTKSIKILHTADWHLGKKLFSKSRLDEQEAVLNELCQICESENIDIVLVSGDIFDTFVPTAEAEELFYRYALSMAKDRIFIAISGNHDDAERFCAPSNIAKQCRIYLVGSFDNSVYSAGDVVGGRGFLRVTVDGTIVNIITCPYPHLSKISALYADLDSEKKSDYANLVKTALQDFSSCYSDEGINICLSHLFVAGSDASDERELGSAALLPKTVFPKSDYVALGHIHKPMTVSKSNNIYYSGSILGYSFDDLTPKSAIVVQFDGNKAANIKRVPLNSGKALLRCEADSFDKAMNFLQDNIDCHVQIMYTGSMPLSVSEIQQLKKMPSYTDLCNSFVHERTKKEYKKRSDKEMFVDFFSSVKGHEPTEQLVEMFLRVLQADEEGIE